VPHGARGSVTPSDPVAQARLPQNAGTGSYSLSWVVAVGQSENAEARVLHARFKRPTSRVCLHAPPYDLSQAGDPHHDQQQETDQE
jgi:hypothetical protein